jgi:hypothetical protein
MLATKTDNPLMNKPGESRERPWGIHRMLTFDLHNGALNT